ncbi:MAG: hypothetical protein N2378_13140 [Chloroflexaceae bacterium]|nr:hypothetical protein [Chloroflexaceae bacterium]
MSLFRDPKRLLAILIAGVAGLIVLLDFAGAGGPLAALATVLVEWAAVITAVGLLLGVVSVTGAHVQRVRARSADWPYSLILIAGLLVMIVAGIFFPLPGRAGIVLPGSLAEVPIRTVFRALYEPVAGSLLALLAFFSLSAALRALGRGSVEAMVIIGVAVLVLVAQLPPVTALPGVGATLQWFNDYVALAGARGLVMGAAIGAFVAGLRVLLGFDTPYLDR